MENIKRKFQLPLTDEHKKTLADRITTINIEIEAKIERKKNLPKEIEGLQEAAAELSHEYKTGTTEIEVDCFWKIDDPEPLKKSLYRSDNGEWVETTDMELLDTQNEPLALPEAIQEAEVLEVGVEYSWVEATELAATIFEKLLIEHGSGDKKKIECVFFLFHNLLEAHTNVIIANQICVGIEQEYCKGDMLVVKNFNYKPFKALLAKLLSEYQDKPETEPINDSRKDYDPSYEVVEDDNPVEETHE